MKVSIRLPDVLFEEAVSVATRERTTLSELVEEGLRAALAKRNEKPSFRIRRATFKGRGVQPGIVEGSWERVPPRIRD